MGKSCHAVAAIAPGCSRSLRIPSIEDRRLWWHLVTSMGGNIESCHSERPDFGARNLQFSETNELQIPRFTRDDNLLGVTMFRENQQCLSPDFRPHSDRA